MKVKSPHETAGPFGKHHAHLGHFTKKEHINRGHNDGGGAGRMPLGAKTRYYPGYEDDSSEGRARIRGFNKAGGPNYMNPAQDKTKYTESFGAAEDAVEEMKSNMDPNDRRNPKSFSDDEARGLNEAAKRKYGIK